MIGGVIHGLFITFLPAILVPMLESYGFTGVTFSDSDVISSGLVLGHAFQNNWLFVALFIVFVAALAWFVNGKSAKPKGKVFMSLYNFNEILKIAQERDFKAIGSFNLHCIEMLPAFQSRAKQPQPINDSNINRYRRVSGVSVTGRCRAFISRQ